MGDGIRPRLAVQKVRCPFCHEDPRVGLQLVCSGCLAISHVACAEEGGWACAACGKGGLETQGRRLRGDREVSGPRTPEPLQASPELERVLGQVLDETRELRRAMELLEVRNRLLLRILPVVGVVLFVLLMQALRQALGLPFPP